MKHDTVVFPKSEFLTDTKSAFSAGYKAYRAQITKDANPYHKNSPDCAAAWARGYDKAASEDTGRSSVRAAAQLNDRWKPRAGLRPARVGAAA